MATRHYYLTSSPVDLTDTLSLADGTAYTCQVQNGNCHVYESATAPTANTPAMVFRFEQVFTIAQASDPVYVWGNGVLLINEAS